MKQTTKFKYRNIGGWKVPYNQAIGVFPIFTLSIRNRINEKKAVNIAITGEAGIGKSYTATQLAMMLDPNFDISKQVVFNLKEFMEAVLNLKTGKPIVFDEPSYAIGKHDWYKQVNNALRKTMESFRYKLHPLIIPIISISLLDKTVRSFLIQYQVVLRDRGEGRVYALSADQFGQDKTYYNRICDWSFKLYIENCSEESCLGCKTIEDCTEWRAIYERKKASIQEQRYTDVLREAIADEERQTKNTTSTKKMVETLYEYRADLGYTLRGFIELTSIRIIIERELGFELGDRKITELRKRLTLKYPSLDRR